MGQRVEATLFDTGLSLLVPHAANWFHSGRAPRLLGSAHPNICPYDKFRAGDGEIFLAVANDGQFRKLCEFIGRQDVAADPRFATNESRLGNRDALRAELEKAFAEYEVEPFCRDLMRAGVPAGPVHTVPQALAQAHAAHRGMLTALGRTHEVETHVRGALNNGLTQQQIAEVLLQTAIYCGVPAAVDSFRAASKVIAEYGK